MESSFLPSIGTVSPLMSSGGSPVAPRARDHHPWCCLLMNRSIPGTNDGSGALNHQKAGEQSWNNPAPLQNFGLGFLTSLGGGYWDKLLAPSPRGGVLCVSARPGLSSHGGDEATAVPLMPDFGFGIDDPVSTCCPEQLLSLGWELAGSAVHKSLSVLLILSPRKGLHVSRQSFQAAGVTFG